MLARRPFRVLAVACLAWGFLSSAPRARATPAAPPTAESVDPSDDIPALVRQLGHADFRVREEASRRLRAVGRPAMPALREALAGDDPEVCSRADSLLRQIERPRIPPGWFADFGDWRRRETINGGRVVEVTQGDRRVEVREGPGGIEMTITGVDDGENVNVTLRARDAADLRRQDAHAHAIYERVAGARANFNMRGRRMLVPPMPMPMPGPGPVPMPRPLPRMEPEIDPRIDPRLAPRRPAARLLPLAPEGGLLRPPGDDLLELEEGIRRQMRGAGVGDADQQAVLEALRLLREIQAQGQMVRPDDLEAQIKKYNALSDAVREKLEALKLPGPGDALPPPARARLGVSVAEPDFENELAAGGVLVTMVVPGSRGDKLGLKAGDAIRRINGRRVADPAALRRVLTDTTDPLVIDIVRDREPAVLKEKVE